MRRGREERDRDRWEGRGGAPGRLRLRLRADERRLLRQRQGGGAAAHDPRRGPRQGDGRRHRGRDGRARSTPGWTCSGPGGSTASRPSTTGCPVQIEYRSPDGIGNTTLQNVGMRLRGTKSRGTNVLQGFKLDVQALLARAGPEGERGRKFAEPLEDERAVDRGGPLADAPVRGLQDRATTSTSPRRAATTCRSTSTASSTGSCRTSSPSTRTCSSSGSSTTSDGSLYACSGGCGYDDSKAEPRVHSDSFSDYEVPKKYEPLQTFTAKDEDGGQVTGGPETELIPMLKCGDVDSDARRRDVQDLHPGVDRRPRVAEAGRARVADADAGVVPGRDAELLPLLQARQGGAARRPLPDLLVGLRRGDAARDLLPVGLQSVHRRHGVVRTGGQARQADHPADQGVPRGVLRGDVEVPARRPTGPSDRSDGRWCWIQSYATAEKRQRSTGR